MCSLVTAVMEEPEDTCDHDTPTVTPVQPVPCDADDQSAPPTSPGKPEVDARSPRELVTSPEAAADASPRGDKVGITCEAPASPIGAVSEQEHEQASAVPKCLSGSLYRCPESYDVTSSSSSSYFGESHVNRLQSFVDSVSAGDDATATTSWSRGRLAADPAMIARGGAGRTTCPDLRKPTPRLAAADEPLDLSLKSPVRRHDTSSSVGEIPFPVPVVPPLFPLLACRESWIAHWAALAAASLQHSLLFPALAVTSQTGTDAISGPGWMASSSPRSSSSSSPPGGNKMADDRRRRTALTAIESFVESSFKPRQQQQQQRLLLPVSSGHDLSHMSTNRKRRRHIGAEVTSSGDEDGGSHEEKRKRAEVSSGRAGSAKDRSVSPRSDNVTPTRDDVSSEATQSKPEVNGDVEYLSCGQDAGAATEHPLVSLEKFVGVSTPLFRSLAAPPSATAAANGISSSPVCRTPGLPPPPVDVAMTSAAKYVGDSAQETVTSRSMRGDVASGSLGRGFTSAQSLLCCNL